MILFEIKNYISDKQRVSLQELSWHFQRDPELMQCMVSHWVRKGVITEAEKPAGCGTRCSQCQSEETIVYQERTRSVND